MGSLADDLAGSPPAVINKPPRGKRVSPLGPDDTAPTDNEAKENDMPRGIYPRKPKAEVPPGTDAPNLEKRARKKRASKKAAKKPNGRSLRAMAGEISRRQHGTGGAARFGVFSDGSVQVDAASCKGILKPDEAKTLVAFIQRLGVK